MLVFKYTIIIYVFRKRVSEMIPTRKMWDHTINMKKVFSAKKRESVSIVKRRKRRGM